jgi:hypothetical protein
MSHEVLTDTSRSTVYFQRYSLPYLCLAAQLLCSVWWWYNKYVPLMCIQFYQLSRGFPARSAEKKTDEIIIFDNIAGIEIRQVNRPPGQKINASNETAAEPFAGKFDDTEARAQVLAAHYKSAPPEMWGQDFGRLATLLVKSSNSERSGLQIEA